jgi:hypothetical protein
MRPRAVIRRLLISMLPGFKEWSERKDGGKKGYTASRGGGDRKKMGTVPLPEAAPSGGVLSYNQARRMSQGKNKAPSEVGSIRSYRSVLTTEEQIRSLEEQVSDLSQQQQDTKLMVEKILAIMTSKAEAQTTPTASAKKTGP